MQSKWESIFETVSSVALGFIVAFCSQLIIFPVFGIHIPFQDNLLITLYFTIISLVRGYFVRRWFNSRAKA